MSEIRNTQTFLSLYNYFSSAQGARLLIITTDISLCLIAYLSAIQLRHNFDFPLIPPKNILISFGYIIFVRIIFFKVFRTYSGIMRFTGQKDILAIFAALTLSTIFLFITSFLIPTNEAVYIPRSILLIEWLIAMALQMGLRVFMRMIYSYLSLVATRTINTVVFGAGTCGDIVRKTILSDGRNSTRIVGFFDDSQALQGKSLAGIRIYSPESEFEEVIKRYSVKKAIIAIDNLDAQRKQIFIDQCLKHKVSVFVIPPVAEWLDNSLNTRQIKQISIEDLLNRPQININNAVISQQINKYVILVTGAAGSIGSELSRQITQYKPVKLIVVDQAESPLWDLALELKERYSSSSLEIELADVRNQVRLEAIFEQYRPNIVFHAAAYKHVPVLESFPQEAISINVLGVKNVADLAVKYGVERFVFISTDKAVRPTNVMGASKRIAEMYTQALNNSEYNHAGVKFITTRFGNVLGSNGSVVPRFERQISAGGPITVTHPDITRYFMTIPEACQLVLEAAFMGKGGEIFLFDMGSPVKIADLAKKMIQLSGFEEGKDIKIQYTGLREGEKLYEELLSDTENTLPTHHHKIMIGKASGPDFNTMEKSVNALLSMMGAGSNNDIVEIMKSVVPEFLSNASRYEKLDKK